jgi:type II secretory pathway component PulF
MPTFHYKGQDKYGTLLDGLVQAATLDVAADTLADEGIVVISLAPERVNLWHRLEQAIQRIRVKDLVVLSRQLAVIVSAGIPLVQGLRIMVAQTSNPALQTILTDVADDVEGGAKLSAALGRHPRAFSSFFVSLVRSGETSGKLDEILTYLADQQEKDYDLHSKLRNGMVYPVFILLSLIVVGVLMMVNVVPQITAILVESNVPLPISTRILIGTSNLLAKFWWLFLIIVVGGGVALRAYIRTPRGRWQWDHIRFRLPIFGQLARKIAIVRFTRSLYTLLAGGVPLTKSLEIVAEVVGSPIYQELILQTRNEVEDGNPLTTIFIRSREVPPMVSQMLNLGEKTGRITVMLEKISAFYAREVDNIVANLVVLMEPIVMIIMGIGVGLLVSAILLPIYNLANAI